MSGSVTPALVCALLLSLAGAASALHGQNSPAEPLELRNRGYRLSVRPDASVVIEGQGSGPLRFTPRFTVLYRSADPELALRPAAIPNVRYNVATWLTGEGWDDGEAGAERRAGEVGDGFDARILEGENAGRTADYHRAGRSTTLMGVAARRVGDRVEWRFPEHPDFALRASLALEEGEGMPTLRFELTAKNAGWYSVGYTGAPRTAAGEAEEIWQPLIWNERRFPDRAYLTLAFRAPVPAALVTRGGTTVGVVADPVELPFDPLPTFENSRFGVLVRDDRGFARPMVFAPVLGGIESRMRPGQSYGFRMRLLVRAGDAPAAFRYAARELYGFRDYRRNASHTLNQTIENLIAYAFSPFARWNPELKGSDYVTDVPGSVKNVSALHPLSVALITDSEKIYRERAHPMIEYLLSREKFLFTVDPEVTGQAASWRMKGPAAPLTELAALYEISGGRSASLLQLADSLSRVERVLNLGTRVRGDAWPNLLALFRATGDSTHLLRARRGADRYLEERFYRRQTDFVDPFVGGEPFFWTEFVSTWMPLYELYQATRERRYLEAALDGARRYAMFVWMAPRVPDTHVLVNQGGLAPHYWYLRGKGHARMEAPEEFVDAWKLSEIGLTPESSSTSSGHRGILLASPAPWLLRLARDAGDDFLRDIARSAVVGRYSNFPGYHINTARTSVFMKPDYPLRPHEDLGYNSIHYNHIWPQIALLFDHLVSEAYYRSGGRIDFPSHYAEGYAYVQSKVYGDRPGRFYGAEPVSLWMPAGLAQVDSEQIDYLAARGRDALHLALMNQSDEPVVVNLRLSPEVVPLEAGRTYPVSIRSEEEGGSETRLVDGSVTIGVPPKGLTALSIRGLGIEPRFQHRIGRGPAPRGESVARLEVGGTTGMLLSMGQDLDAAYVFLAAGPRETREARLHYRHAGDWETVSDDDYPFEFSRPLTPGRGAFEFFVETVEMDGRVRRSRTAVLGG